MRGELEAETAATAALGILSSHGCYSLVILFYFLTASLLLLKLLFRVFLRCF